MKLKIFLTIFTFIIFGAGGVLAAENSASNFEIKKNILQSIIEHKYAGPEKIDFSVSEQELRESWLPYINEQIGKEDMLKGSEVKDIELLSDGSIRLSVNIGQSIKKMTWIPFFSNVNVWVKLNTYDGQLEAEVTKIKAGFIPIKVCAVTKLILHSKVILSDMSFKPKEFAFDKITVTDTDLSVSGRYLLGKKPVTAPKK